jgi:16S rRNA C967 or C1407 C5-methylase (RsmB/RsmF family)
MLPQRLIESLKSVKGFDEAAFRQVHNSGEQVTSIRLNQAKKVNGEWALVNTEEASSMFLWQVLEQTIGEKTKGLKVLDLCAAPGGKSTLLASYFKNGLLVSNEVIKSRASVLVENITKWGSENVVVTNNDPKDFAALENYFDVIVVDAPCSGSGLFRRDPEAINEWSENNVALCSQRQQRILADVYPALGQPVPGFRFPVPG